MDTLVALAADLHEVGAIGQTCQGELEALGVARCLHLMEQHTPALYRRAEVPAAMSPLTVTALLLCDTFMVSTSLMVLLMPWMTGLEVVKRSV